MIYRLALDTAVAELRNIKDASDANAAHLQEANDKIYRLEAENAEFRTQLLNQRRNNSPSPLMVSGVYARHLITIIFYPLFASR